MKNEVIVELRETRGPGIITSVFPNFDSKFSGARPWEGKIVPLRSSITTVLLHEDPLTKSTSTFDKSILMASFLRRFTTSASAGKTMYFSLAVVSALPVYAVLNENSSSPPPNSRANVFVSYLKFNVPLIH